MEIENDHDVEIYIRKLKSIIKYQQFLMRLVDYLNELLSVPIALLMVTSVALKCISMYNMTINQGSISDKGRTIVTILSVIAEFFLAYGLPAQILMDESTATADTIYSECKWYLPKLRCLRCHFLIMMTRNQRGVCIRAGNYHVINNGTVLLMVKTAYSFYAFLQNVT
ncbi:odorant receptor 49b-like [Anoplophora glabripennis]|uniref:odorant receptor 49b-like n=1 Tax=Anoplophora glabripennis TaxID=217634 RepID=UPI000C75A2AA|nr:odorant receptor 49b-like [Anoplophora glabripennis]